MATLEQGETTILEYVWIDGSGLNMRSKAKVIKKLIKSIEEIPDWNYDGSSCQQAKTLRSEIILKPVAIYRDPFRLMNNLLVLCDTYIWKDENFSELIPANTNFRAYSKGIFESVVAEKPWFGIEQEYSLLEKDTAFNKQPLFWPYGGFPQAQGPYYCSVGAQCCFGRAISDAMIKACIYSGLTISGTNAEVMPSQWEYQIGPCEGIEIGDQIWISRYILQRVAEDFNVCITFLPKLFKDWNGAGCHTNYSTEKMRLGVEGMDYIHSIIKNLSNKHQEHLEVYGDNSARLTGIHETSSKEVFTYGVGDRSASVRIPTSTAQSICCMCYDP
eukprot:403333455